MSTSTPSLRENFRITLEEYPVENIGNGIEQNEAYAAICNTIPQIVNKIVEVDYLRPKGSCGQGRWTSIPWMGVFDPQETTSTREGIYVVYIFEPTQKRVSLTLNQGVTQLMKSEGRAAAKEELRRRASMIRDQIDLEGFEAEEIVLPDASSGPKLYGPGAIFHKTYSLPDLPNDQTLKNDLIEITNKYSEWTTKFGSPVQERESTPQYASIAEATEKVITDLRQHEEPNWLESELTESILKQWSGALSGYNPNSEPTAEVHFLFDQIEALYEQSEDRLRTLVEDLNVGELNVLSPHETLFIVLFRDLQDSFGIRQNLSQEKFHLLRDREKTEEVPATLKSESKPRNADEILTQLRANGQLIFHGPPGTGKTYTARRFARWWINTISDTPKQEQLRFVTFHPSFNYEDFLEGLTAKKDDGDTVSYEIEDGIFKEICKDARTAYKESPDPDQAPPYVLVIDEINRGNLAKIFGETITQLELDKRLGADEEITINLAHSGKEFVIPPNLYLIGTMNTADRSIALVDAALRRRFGFLSFPPDYQVFSKEYDLTSKSPAFAELLNTSVAALQVINKNVLESGELGKGKQVGHSYLLGLESPLEIVNAWRYNILPLLEEYYFGELGRLQSTIFETESCALFDNELSEIAAFGEETLRAELKSLLNRTSQNYITLR